MDLTTCDFDASTRQRLLCAVLRRAMIVDSDNDDLDSGNPDYQFSTPDGLCLARKVLRPLLPYDPHDDQLEGICKMIDGINLMALTRTGVEEEMASSLYSTYLLTSYAYFRNSSSSLTGSRHSQSTRTHLPRRAATALIPGNWRTSMSQCFACPQSSSCQKDFRTFSSISRSGTDFALSEWMRFTCYTTGV